MFNIFKKTRQCLLLPNHQNVNVRFNLLGVGLPRTGTGYTHMLLRRFGLDVGHECIRPDGCIDWQLSLRPKTKKPYGEGSLRFFKRGLVIRNTRNPLTTIPSFIKRVIKVKPAMDFIQENLSLKLRGLNELEKCIEVMFAFENYLDSWNSDYVFKIESDAHKLYNFLKKHYDDLCPFDQKLVDEMQFYNSDNHGGWTPKLMKMKKSLKSNHIEKLNSMCRKLGYPLIFK